MRATGTPTGCLFSDDSFLSGEDKNGERNRQDYHPSIKRQCSVNPVDADGMIVVRIAELLQRQSSISEEDDSEPKNAINTTTDSDIMNAAPMAPMLSVLAAVLLGRNEKQTRARRARQIVPRIIVIIMEESADLSEYPSTWK